MSCLYSQFLKTRFGLQFTSTPTLKFCPCLDLFLPVTMLTDITSFALQIEPGEFDTEYSTTLHEDGLETSSLSLSFVAKDKHFIDGTMRLKCTASISRMYTMSNEEMFLGGRQQSSTLQVPENESKGGQKILDINSILFSRSWTLKQKVQFLYNYYYCYYSNPICI